MGKLYHFPVKKKKQGSIQELFSEQEYSHYIKYLEDGEIWRQEKMNETVYEGYPFCAPCEPIHEGMLWYVNEKKNFGVWIINDSPHNIFENEEILFGWSPFVRFSTAPSHEPINITSAQLRERLVWYVDEDGYGQYSVIKNNGQLWIPIERPESWDDHNKRFGNI